MPSHQTEKPNALIIGANSAIAKALIEQLEDTHAVSSLSRKTVEYTDGGLEKARIVLSKHGEFDRIICCTGILQDEQVQPEKNLTQVTEQGLEHYFKVNTILPMMCIKHFYPLLSQQAPSAFACLSAMVGSIEQNRLGGWYGYRSSKAALNMLIKTSSIEIARKRKNTCLVAIHPGTTQSSLSAPFAQGIKQDKYYTPSQTATRILDVMTQLKSQDTGSFFNWNRERLPW